MTLNEKLRSFRIDNGAFYDVPKLNECKDYFMLDGNEYFSTDNRGYFVKERYQPYAKKLSILQYHTKKSAYKNKMNLERAKKVQTLFDFT